MKLSTRLNRYLIQAIAAKLSKAWALKLPIHNRAEDSMYVRWSTCRIVDTQWQIVHATVLI